MPKVKPKDVSDTIAKCQVANTYHLARRSRFQGFLDLEQRKLCSVLANQSEPFEWSLTMSCKVFPVTTYGVIAGWRIHLVKRKGGKQKAKGQEKKSLVFPSQIAGENAMFEFQKNLESPKPKKKLNQWVQFLLLLSTPVELIVDDSSEKKPTGHVGPSC
jgi:hypothetical protein